MTSCDTVEFTQVCLAGNMALTEALSTTLAHSKYPIATEMLLRIDRYLTGKRLLMRCYQRLWYTETSCSQ
jgi:hypothetical protein